MKTKLFISSVASIVIFLSALMPQAYAAISVPEFPQCASPKGEVVASYGEGSHGVVGRTEVYTGSDTVYKVNSKALTQCLCPSSGNGIQTNWLEADTYSESEIAVLVNQGWTYVPNGLAWGLEEKPYLAKNIDYSCKAGNGSGGTSDSKSEGASASLSESANYIFSLASTGNMLFIIAIFSLGIAFIGTGFFLSFKKRS